MRARKKHWSSGPVFSHRAPRIVGSRPQGTPTMLDWQVSAVNDSMYNTPYFAIYLAGLVFEWLDGLGGLEAMFEINRRRPQSYTS